MTIYAFVDGGALFKFIDEAAETLSLAGKPSIDYKAMFDDLALFSAEVPSEDATRIFFYDAHPSKRGNEADADFDAQWHEKDALFRQLSRLPRVHVRTGVTTRRRRKAGIIQKGVDMLLALDAFGHATSGNIEEAILVLNDLDFLPLLDALTQTRVRTTLVYVPRKTNELLIEAADFSRSIGLRNFLNWCADKRHREWFSISFASNLSTRNWRDQKKAELPGRGDVLFGKISGGADGDLFAVNAPTLLKQETMLCKSLDLLIEEIERRAEDRLKFSEG